MLDVTCRKSVGLVQVLVFCALFSSLVFPAYAQFFEQKDVFGYKPQDLEKIFKEGLSRGGKKLSLSGKKIGDAGLKLLLSKDFLGKVTSLDLRYNGLSEKGAQMLADSKGA